MQPFRSCPLDLDRPFHGDWSDSAVAKAGGGVPDREHTHVEGQRTRSGVHRSRFACGQGEVTSSHWAPRQFSFCFSEDVGAQLWARSINREETLEAWQGADPSTKGGALCRRQGQQLASRCGQGGVSWSHLTQGQNANSESRLDATLPTFRLGGRR